MKLKSNYNYEQDPVFQKYVRTDTKPSRKDDSKSKDRKKDYSEQRQQKRPSYE